MSDDKRIQIISLIRDTIRASEPTAQIILYGSRARGDAREDSDWDVLATVDKPRLSLKDRSKIQIRRLQHCNTATFAFFIFRLTKKYCTNYIYIIYIL